MTKEQQDDINSLKELIADKSISADERQVYIDGLAELEKVKTISLKDFAKQQGISITSADADEQEEKSVRKKPQTTKPKKAITKKAKAVKKPTALPSDVDAMKKAIKERTGKTEAECEDIIAQYRKLRDKAKVNRAKRTEKLKSNDDLITGTNVITPVAQIEKDAEIVKVKIEKQVEQIENKAEREVVKKDKTKDEVKVEVEQKVVKQLAKLSDDMVSSATTFVKNIQTELKKVDKTEAKKFLLGLRNEIDVLLSKFSDGGSTIQTYNITENESASSVNPSKFSMGGGVNRKFMSGGMNDMNSGLNYGKKDDVFIEVSSLYNSKLEKQTFMGKPINPKQVMSLDSFMEFIKKYENDERYEVNVPIELFTKESFNQYNTDNSKLKFITGSISLLGKDDLLKKYIRYKESLLSNPLTYKEIEKINNRYQIKNAPEKTTIIKRIVSRQLLKKGGMIGDYRIGDIVKVSNENDNENYDDFREKKLRIVDKITIEDNNLAFDEGLKDQALYTFEDVETNDDIPFSLYDYELEKFARGGVSGKDNRAKKVVRTINGKKREFPIGDAWRKEHSQENKSEKYEVPYSSRKSQK